MPKPKVTINTKGRKLHPHYKQTLSFLKKSSLRTRLLNALKCSQLKVGLLINFGESSLKWKRFVN